jgi:hypothetical protein
MVMVTDTVTVTAMEKAMGKAMEAAKAAMRTKTNTLTVRNRRAAPSTVAQRKLPILRVAQATAASLASS